MSKFQENIKIVRKQRKQTQKQFATLFDISERAYQYYEAGTREPNIETLIEIADKLELSIDYLVGRTDNPEVNK